MFNVSTCFIYLKSECNFADLAFASNGAFLVHIFCERAAYLFGISCSNNNVYITLVFRVVFLVMWVKSLSVFGVVLGLALIDMDENDVTAQHCLVNSLIKVVDNVRKSSQHVPSLSGFDIKNQ